MTTYALALIALYIFDTGFMFAMREEELNKEKTKATRILARVIYLMILFPFLFIIAF